MTQENEVQEPVEEITVEEEAEAATVEVATETEDEAAEETGKKKQTGWTAVVIAILVAILGLCTAIVCIAAIVILFAGGNTASVTGTVVYRERMALPPDAVVRVQVQDVSLMDVAAQVMGEQVITNPGQVPIPYDVAYDPGEIQDNHTYAVAARIEDGNGKLLFINTQSYPVITRGAPTEDVEVLVERVGGEPAPPPQQAYIKIDQPTYGETLDISQPVKASGTGAGLPEGNVVVQALDRDGNVLTEQPTTLQGENVGTGGQGTWSVELKIKTEPGMAGRIYAFSPSPLDGSIIAEDSVEVSLGKTAAKPAFLEITVPHEGAVLDTTKPIQVEGEGGGLPEGNVVVQALDANEQILAQEATILQGQDVGTGGAGTWSVQLKVDVPAGMAGKIVAFSPSPADGESYVASAVVNVTYGEASALEGTSWVLADTVPGTEVKALFENGQVSGSAGCNSYSGTYTTSTVAGVNKIRIGPLASTMMMCEETVMEQEQAYLAALQTAKSYQVEENVLTLFHADGTLLYEGEPVE